MKNTTIEKMSKTEEANAHARGAAGIRQLTAENSTKYSKEVYGWIEVTNNADEEAAAFTCKSLGAYGDPELSYVNETSGKAISGQFTDVDVTAGSIDAYLYKPSK